MRNILIKPINGFDKIKTYTDHEKEYCIKYENDSICVYKKDMLVGIFSTAFFFAYVNEE